MESLGGMLVVRDRLGFLRSRSLVAGSFGGRHCFLA
jgi:hypothetical protein